MKTYIITEKDINSLLEWFKGDYWTEGKIEEWKNNLQEIPANDLSVPFEIDIMDLSLEERMKRFVIVELKSPQEEIKQQLK